METIALPRAARGLSLIELLVVLAIIGTLTAIAYPGYQQYVQKSNRQEGKECLMRLANKQEVYYSRFNRYADDLEALGEDGARCGLRGDKQGDDLYVLTIGAATKACDPVNCFRLFARAKNAQADDGNLRLIVNRKKDGLTTRAGQRQKRQERKTDDGWEPWDSN